MNRRPGQVNVTTEVGFCNFCGRTRNLRTEQHVLGALVRTIVTCESCHRTLSSSVGVAAAPEPELQPEPEPVVEEAAPEPEAPPAKGPAKKQAPKKPSTKTAAKKPAAAGKTKSTGGPAKKK